MLRLQGIEFSRFFPFRFYFLAVNVGMAVLTHAHYLWIDYIIAVFEWLNDVYQGAAFVG